MPRVVPSQVVALIDKMFPWAVNQTDDTNSRVTLDLGNAPAGLWPMARDRFCVEWLSVRRRPSVRSDAAGVTWGRELLR